MPLEIKGGEILAVKIRSCVPPKAQALPLTFVIVWVPVGPVMVKSASSMVLQSMFSEKANFMVESLQEMEYKLSSCGGVVS